MSPVYKVYWAPGCSSCLKTKEFLIQHDIDFESVNVAAEPDAMTELRKLGLRSFPVIQRGSDATFCQDLQDVADFVGVALAKQALSPGELVAKTNRILLAAQRFMRQLSERQLAEHFPGRDRPFRDLAYHIFMVVQGFVEAADGGSLKEEAFFRTCPDELTGGNEIADAGESVRLSLQTWWQTNKDALPKHLDTYYGRRRIESVLERTAWHAAQHCRQLQAIVEKNGLTPDGPLAHAELAGLPLPENIYDNETPM